jgi:4-amino-4-deoxy-L-arabinose transferase-like glycosyltransferase
MNQGNKFNSLRDFPRQMGEGMLGFFQDHKFVIFLLVLVAITRLVHLEADPPIYLSPSGGLFGDEAALAHNARNKVLFGMWITDEWNPFIYNPILTILEYFSFLAFGVGLIQLRLVNILVVLFSFYLLYISLEESAGKRVALISMVLLIFNYIFLMYNRLGLNDTFLIFPMAVTVYFWFKGLNSPLALFGAGISSFACYITKASALYFILAIFFSIVFVSLKHVVLKGKISTAIEGLFLYLLGLVLSYGAWYRFFFIPNKMEFDRISSSWFRLAAPHSLGRYWHNLSSLTFIKYLAAAPLETIVSWISLPFLIFVFLRNWKRNAPVEALALMWLIGGYLALNGLNYRPLRYFIPLIPALCIIASIAMDKIWNISFTREFMLKKASIIQGLILGIIVIFWTKFLFSHIIGFQKIMDLGLIVLGVAALCAAIYYVIKELNTRKLGALKIPATTVLCRSVIVSIILVSIYFQVPAYLRWLRNPQYTVLKTSQELGEMFDQAYIAGLWSPLATIENKHKALYVGNNWFNYRDTFTKYPVTHLFLWDGNHKEELRFLKRAYPKVMRRTRLLKMYNIKGLPVRLYEINSDSR